MRPLPRPLIAVALLLTLTAAAAAQAGRLPIPVGPSGGLPFGPHLPIGPHMPGRPGGDPDNSGICILICILLGMGTLGLLIGAVAARAEARGDLIHTAEKVAPKVERTRRLLELLARRDRLFEPIDLRFQVETCFYRVQECWQKADYGPLGDLMRPALRAKHQLQMAVMRAAGLRNVLRNLSIERLEFVHLDCPADPDQQRVTALITFRAASSYVDARTGDFRQGSQVPVLFEEFWVFRRLGDAWHLEAIERSHRSNRLTRPNRVEGLSEDQLQHAEECAAP